MPQSNLYSPTKTNTSMRVTHTALQARSAPQFVKTHILVTVLNAQAQTVSSSTNNSYGNSSKQCQKDQALFHPKQTPHNRSSMFALYRNFWVHTEQLQHTHACVPGIIHTPDTVSLTFIFAQDHGKHVFPQPNKNKSRATAQLLSTLVSGACKFLFLMPEPSLASCMALGKSLQLPLHFLPLQ